jgi:hypothetical protein
VEGFFDDVGVYTYTLVCEIVGEREAGVRTEAVQGDAGVVDHEVDALGM